MASESRKQLESWLKTIDVKGKVLDVGGSQNPIKGRTKSWEVSDYKILDLEQPHECKQKPDIMFDINEQINVFHDDFSGMTDVNFRYPSGGEPIEKPTYKGGLFDAVFMIETMEYLYNPNKAIRNCQYILKKGATLYLSTHYIYGLHNPKGLDYLRYTRYGIEKLIARAGFKIEEIIPRTMRDESKVALKSIYSNEGMRINYDDGAWCECGHLIKALKK